MDSTKETQQEKTRLRASVRIGILPESGAPWGCKWTLSPPPAIGRQALQWVQKQYGNGALSRNGTLVIADRPGMVADVVLAFSRLKLGFNPLRATKTKVGCKGVAKLLNVPQAARKMHVSRQTIYTWIGKGKIKPVRASQGKYRISEEQLTRPLLKPKAKYSREKEK